jgi:Serine hydrolase (FSH1)
MWSIYVLSLAVKFISHYRKFCISISGFPTPDPLASKIFAAGYTTPTLHVIGETDIIVIEDWSNALIDVSRTKRVERHPGGM